MEKLQHNNVAISVNIRLFTQKNVKTSYHKNNERRNRLKSAIPLLFTFIETGNHCCTGAYAVLGSGVYFCGYLTELAMCRCS